MDSIVTEPFGTKGETLAALSSRLSTAVVLPQAIVTRKDWARAREEWLAAIALEPWANGLLAVRSSFTEEDGACQSAAGLFDSMLNVSGSGGGELAEAIDAVFANDLSRWATDQVLIQPFVDDAVKAAVAFSYDPNTQTPYYIINYGATDGDPEIVTGGLTNDLRTFVCHRAVRGTGDAFLDGVIGLLRELEGRLHTDLLDIEIVQSASRGLVLLQARRLNGARPEREIGSADHEIMVAAIAAKIEEAARPHPDLHGQKGIFGIMPDWNPAEIIGVRPRPLALSLYGKLITDENWAYQRDNYGYRNLRSFPLMKNFFGLPYIDIRVSFNSFLPKSIPGELAARLVEYYLEELRRDPSRHDKVEFDIIHSCCHLDLPDRLAELGGHGFSGTDIETIFTSLKTLTTDIVNGAGNLWRADLDKFAELKARQEKLLASDLGKVSTIYWLLEYCERYGSVPFAGIARAAFIGVQFLGSLVTRGIFSEQDLEDFHASFATVTSEMQRDLTGLERRQFLGKYGHLRPGTYDIRQPRYDECPDEYFDWTAAGRTMERPAGSDFAPSQLQMDQIEARLKNLGLGFDADTLFEFIRASIAGREYGKFVFTDSLSDALSLFKELCQEHGFSANDASYANIECIRHLYNGSEQAEQVLAGSIEEGKIKFQRTRQISLPPLITDAADVHCFHLPKASPNFITNLQTSGPVVMSTSPRRQLEGGILFIANADPGFDWIFSAGIAGFITQYGGVNSHMAIRANELGIPAVIGAGEQLYSQWALALALHIDAPGKLVRPLL